MMINSDDEDSGEDMFGDLPQPKQKKCRNVEIEDLASGPQDFITALTEAGFHPRADDLPNVLSVQQSDFQHTLKENFMKAVNYPRNIEFFVSECDTFLDVKPNFIKALQPTENATAVDTDLGSSMVLPQDSLIRLLMNIEDVQPRLMRSLLKRFTKVVKDDKRLPSEIICLRLSSLK